MVNNPIPEEGSYWSEDSLQVSLILTPVFNVLYSPICAADNIFNRWKNLISCKYIGYTLYHGVGNERERVRPSVWILQRTGSDTL